ncbi:MAG: nucleotidyltransferase family protein [Chloroflexi bacterium]|nr:nucleotidyltransferase family protein [Chloroflexota bacterium]
MRAARFGTSLAPCQEVMSVIPPQQILEPEGREFYRQTLGVFENANLDVLVGGAYAFARYTGIERHTKDLDVFVREGDFERTLAALKEAGYGTEVPFPHWLGKAHHGEYFVDVIYGAGNGIARVDDEWFQHASADHVFDVPVRLCPAEEMIWSKAFIQERERYDGADVAHLLLARADHIDWPRLLRRFGPNWRVLMSHLVLFGFIYPSDRQRIPGWVMQDLMRRLETSLRSPEFQEPICRGTVLSRQQYLVDVNQRGYQDARGLADNPMTDYQIANWTAGIARDGSKDT